MSEQQLADNFCREIDIYLEKLKGKDVPKREAITKSMSRLNIASAVLPIAITFVSGYAYIVTQQVFSLFISIVDIIPPLLIKNAKNQMAFYNTCVGLELNFTSLKGDVNNLAVLGELKNSVVAVRQQLDRLKEALGTTLQIQI